MGTIVNLNECLKGNGGDNLLKVMYLKYKNSSLSDECGGPQIYVLAATALFFLLALYVTFAYAHKVQVMATRLHDGIKTAAITALGDNTLLDPVDGGVHVSNASAVQQEFMANLQDQVKNWPQSSYTLQSLQVFGEGDKGSAPPSGFSEPIPGTSLYISMIMNITIVPGVIPMSNTHWAIPINVLVTPNSYESSTGTWNLVRGT